jgi:hypothetical protein
LKISRHPNYFQCDVANGVARHIGLLLKICTHGVDLPLESPAMSHSIIARRNAVIAASASARSRVVAPIARVVDIDVLETIH